MIEAEEVDFGRVTWNDYRAFLSFSTGVFGFICYIIVSILVSLLQLSCSYSLTFWASKDAEEQKKSKWPGLLGAATVGYLFFSFSRAFLGVLIINSSAKNMMRKMTESVLRARILFFDSNPIGRIVTRFSKDITVID